MSKIIGTNDTKKTNKKTTTEFINKEFTEVEGGYYDKDFYFTPNGSFWDIDGYYFNKEGYDINGGYYDDNWVYVEPNSKGKGGNDNYDDGYGDEDYYEGYAEEDLGDFGK